MVISLILGDSFQIMDGMIQRVQPSFDMIFLDPPFTEWHATNTARYNVGKLSYLCKELLKPNGVIWLWGYVPQLVDDWHYWDRWFKCLFDMIRVKTTMAPPPVSAKYPIRAHENIWCLCKKAALVKDLKLQCRARRPLRKVKVHEQTMREDGRAKMMKEYKFAAFEKSYFMYPSIGSGSKEYWGHPTQKPIRMVRKLIKISTEEGDWILDPFAGVSGTLIAAEELGRNCVGIEIERQYTSASQKRIHQMRDLNRLEQWLK